MAETESLGQLLLCLFILVLLIVDNANFIIYHWVTIVDSHRFLKGHQSSLQAVQFEVLHANVEGCLVAAWEETICRPVRVHGLVCFIKCRKSMTEGDPTWSKVLVQAISLLEILPG